jgi:hypothetical protein
MGLATSFRLGSRLARPPRACRALTMATEARLARTRTPPTAAIAYVTFDSPLFPPLPVLVSTSVGGRLSSGDVPEGEELPGCRVGADDGIIVLGELVGGATGTGIKVVGDGGCVGAWLEEGWLDGADVGCCDGLLVGNEAG